MIPPKTYYPLGIVSKRILYHEYSFLSKKVICLRLCLLVIKNKGKQPCRPHKVFRKGIINNILCL